MKRTSRHQLFSLFLLVALLLTSSATALAEEGPLPGDTVALPVGARTARGLEPTVSKDAPIGIEPTLAQLHDAYQAAEAAQLAAFGGNPHVDLAAGAARVILEMAADPETQRGGKAITEVVALADGQRAYIEHAPQVTIRSDLADAIAATGAIYETAYENLVQVLAPIESLAALSQIPGVSWVRLPYPATATELPREPKAEPDAPQVGSQTSEGVALTQTNLWNSAGYTGAGVNVAIFDFGFTDWQSVQASGDLAGGGNLVLKDYSAVYSFNPDTPYNEHGTACAEIVYDMAPGSKLYLYAFETDVELGNAINDFRNNVSGKRIATMSIGYVNAGPYDGTGPINTMIDNALSSGILWINSAGNNQRKHWSGVSAPYGSTDTVVFGSGNVQGIGPTPGSVWSIFGGATITAFLEWNDWNAARTGNQNHIDYDLRLIQWTGSGWVAIVSSLGNQCGSSVSPTEWIYYEVPPGGPYYYGLAIERDSGGGACPNNFGHWMQLHSFTPTPIDQSLFWYSNQCNSVLIPSDGDSAMTVGATLWDADSVAPLFGLESYSSLGPRNASGGSNPGTAVNKPDVVAPAGVSGVTYGPSGFSGTSAAAPHVAGMAAVVWSRFPAYAQADVRKYIQGQALYRSDGGVCGGSTAASVPESGTKNNRYGWGRISVPAIAPTCYTLSTSVSPSGGTVSANPPPDCESGTKYTAGTVVQLTANPSSGYAFASWSGDVGGSVNPTSVTMSSNKAVTANFSQISTAHRGYLSLVMRATPPVSGGDLVVGQLRCDTGDEYVRIDNVGGYYGQPEWLEDPLCGRATDLQLPTVPVSPRR